MPAAAARSLVVFAFLTTAGCIGAAPGADDADPAVAERGLTRAPATAQDSWVVSISAGGKGCTASILSPHWLLTAAHCANVAQSSTLSVTQFELPNALRHLYNGGAHYYPNPDYSTTCPLGVCVDTDADDDIGLIELTDGAFDVASTGQALLFDDDEEPYHGRGSRTFKILGYGRGTDPGGSDDCDDGSARAKRVGDGFTVDVSDDGYQAHAPYGDTHPCPGDSGGPWLFTRGTPERALDLVFGVMSSLRPDVVIVGPKMWSALVRPRVSWITQTAAGATHPLMCQLYTIGTWNFRRCSERRIPDPVVWPPPVNFGG